MGGISKKAELLLSPGRCPWGINREGARVTFEGKYIVEGKRPWSFRKLTPASVRLPCEMPCAAHIHCEREMKA